MTARIDATPAQMVARGHRGMRLWTAITSLALTIVALVAISAMAAGSTGRMNQQREVIARQDDALRQVCQVAGDRVALDRTAAEVCRRVGSGEGVAPAVVVLTQR